MSSTNITQGDSRAVGTEEQNDIAFNVQVIAVPNDTDHYLLSQNKFETIVDVESAQGSSPADNADSKEKQTDYTESHESPLEIRDITYDLKRNRSLFSVPTRAAVYITPRISRSEKSYSDPTHEAAIKIKEQAGMSVNSSFSIKSNACVHIESGFMEPETDSTGSVGQLMLKELEDDGSFITIETCQKEKMTSTDVTTIFSLDNRTQNVLMESSDYRNQPPPPYYEPYGPQQSEQIAYQGRLGQTPVYQQQNVGYMVGPTEASRAPPYRRSEQDPENLFQTKEIRNKFVRRVYMILAIQLLFTFGLITFCIHEKHARSFVIRRWELQIAAMVGLITVTLPLVCYMSTRRIFPLNFILLSLLTIFMAYLMAFMSCFYKTNIVMLAIGVTAAICTLLSILACMPWFDITGCGMILCISLIIVMIFGFIAMLVAVFTGSDTLYIVYSCLITLVMCVYLMYDTQQILGGRRVELSPEEYILGALTLYIDIIIIFQHILFLMGRLNR